VKTILVVANQTLSGSALVERVLARAQEGDVRFVAVVPRNRPQSGLVIYDDAVRESAQLRVNLAVDYMRQRGVVAEGEVGDPDPFTAVMDAVDEHDPDEIILSTLPSTTSGWLRRDLISRVEHATGLPIEHVVVDPQTDRAPFTVTLIIAARTARGRELHERLMKRSGEDRQHVFIVVVPLQGKDGGATSRAHNRARALVGELRADGLLAEGTVGDPDPFTAAMNAVQAFRIDEIVVSTYPDHRSGWQRANLVQRLKGAAGVPVDHVVAESEPEAAGASAGGATAGGEREA